MSVIPDPKPYVLPNRKAFADFVTRTFLKHLKTAEEEFKDDLDKDPCLARSGDTAVKKLLPYQELIRDFIMEESPYRGILLNHGLGSGKSFTSIAVALSLIETKPIYVMLPASLKPNYKREILTLGKPLYERENHWVYFSYADNPEARAKAKATLKLKDEFLDSRKGVWMVDSSKEPNWESLDAPSRKLVEEQILEILESRFTFLNYNGNLAKKLPELLGLESDGKITKNPFHHSLVVVDEAHMLMSMMFGTDRKLAPLYDALFTARDCRLVFLTGTPVINDALEMSVMFNLLRGRIETYYFPAPGAGSIKPEELLKSIPSVDTVEWSATKRKWMATRNPQFFTSVYDSSGVRTSVRYDAKKNRAETTEDYLKEIEFELSQKGWKLNAPEVIIEYSSALPMDRKQFYDNFLDVGTLKVKNPEMFMRRIQGLVSYYKGIDPRMVPERLGVEDTLIQVPMSHEQYVEYQRARREEIKEEANKAKYRMSGQDLPSTYMSATRMVCNYAVPAELRELSAKEETLIADDEDTDAIATVEKRKRSEIRRDLLDLLEQNKDQYFTKSALKRQSPKMLEILNRIESGEGTQLVYSSFRNAEGLAFFGEVLKAQGYREFKVKRQDGSWVVDSSIFTDMDESTRFFGFFTGVEDEVEKDIYRQIFNSEWESLKREHPQIYQALGEKYATNLTNVRGEIMKVFMVSRAGAAGITLRNVRGVHVMEPFWNPAMIDQVIGRAIRVCSHAALLPEERNVTVQVYMTVFNEDIYNASEDNAALLRKFDTIPKRYVQEFNPDAPVKIEPATTDEILYNISYEKRLVIQQFTDLTRRAAIDCEIHKPMHVRSGTQQHCMRFDTRVGPEDLAFRGDLTQDALDSEVDMNRMKLVHQFQRIRVKTHLFIYKPSSGELFDHRIFDMSKRLLKVGVLEKDKVVLLT